MGDAVGARIAPAKIHVNRAPLFVAGGCLAAAESAGSVAGGEGVPSE